MDTEHEETDHVELHEKLERQGDDMESGRDDLENETQTARQDIRSKVGDQRVPGAQDEQEEIIHGREAVEADDEHEENGDDGQEGDDSAEDSEGGGSEGAGYREDEE